MTASDAPLTPTAVFAQRGVYDAGGGCGAEAAPEAAILVRFSAAEESVGAISQRASLGFFRKGDVAVCVLMETSSGEVWEAVRLIPTRRNLLV